MAILYGDDVRSVREAEDGARANWEVACGRGAGCQVLVELDDPLVRLGLKDEPRC